MRSARAVSACVLSVGGRCPSPLPPPARPCPQSGMREMDPVHQQTMMKQRYPPLTSWTSSMQFEPEKNCTLRETKWVWTVRNWFHVIFMRWWSYSYSRRGLVLHSQSGGSSEAAGSRVRVSSFKTLQSRVSYQWQHQQRRARIKTRVSHKRHEGAGGSWKDPWEVSRLWWNVRWLRRRWKGFSSRNVQCKLKSQFI